MTKKEDLSKKPLIILKKRRLSITAAVIAIVAVIVIGGITASYIAFRPGAPSSPTPTASPAPTSSPAPTPSPTATPTPSPMPTPSPSNASSPTPTPSATPSPTPTPTPTIETHTVDWTEMANYTIDSWNVTMTNPYTISLNDSMTVSSGQQYLGVNGFGSNGLIWFVVFVNSTYLYYETVVNGSAVDSGYLNCINGIAQVTVDAHTISFIGSTTFTSNVNFQNLDQIQTLNGDGSFNGGELEITVQ